MDGDDLWCAAVTGDQDYNVKPTMKKQAAPSHHNYPSNYDDQEYGNANKDYYFTDRPKMYSGKKSYEEGQYNYGDAQNEQPNPKRQNVFTPNHPSNTKRQNVGGQTTQQLASKKYFADKRNKFNLTSLKGNKGNQGNNQAIGDSVTRPLSNNNNHMLNKAPIRNNFSGPPPNPSNQNIQTSQKDSYEGPKLSNLHPNLTKDGILLGRSHEDKVLFYNTRANSGTEQSNCKPEAEPESAQSAWDDYHRYHYVRKKANENENINRNECHEDDDKFRRSQHQRTYDVVEERIKELYNESLKESGDRESNTHRQYDGTVDRNTDQYSGKQHENLDRYVPGPADVGRGVGRGWHGDDRYGSRGFGRDDTPGFRDRGDDGWHEGRDELNHERYPGRYEEDVRRHGGRDQEDDRRYGGRNREGWRNSDRDWEDNSYHGRDGGNREWHGERETAPFPNRDMQRGSRFDDRGFTREDRFDKQEPERGDIRLDKRDPERGHIRFDKRDPERSDIRFDKRDPERGDIRFDKRDPERGDIRFDTRQTERGDIRHPQRDRRFEQDNNRFEKPYYIVEKDKETGGEKQRYPIKGNRNRNTEYPIKGNRNTYKDVQDLTQEYHKSTFKQPDFNKDDVIVRKDGGGGSGTKLSSDNKDKKTDKGDIKQMLIDAGNKSVMNFRKSRTSSVTKNVSSSYASTIGSIANTMRPGNPIIKYIVPLGNRPMVYPAGSMGNRLVNPSSTNVSSSMNHVSSSTSTRSNADTGSRTAGKPAVDSSGSNIIRGPSGNPLYHVAKPPPNAVIKSLNPMLNSLMNTIPINSPLRFVPPLQYVPPGALPVPTPNVPMIVRYNSLPAPVLRHPLLNNVTIPNEPSFLSTQPLTQDAVAKTIQNMSSSNIPRVEKKCDNNNKTPKPLMSINIGENSPQPLMAIAMSNSSKRGILPDPVESHETKKERKQLLQNAIKQIDARKPINGKSKKFKVNPKKPWFDHECHVLHKKRLRKLVRLKKARNQKNEKEIEELRQAIREINREYVPLLRDRKSKHTAYLESKGEIGLLCEMAVTSLVDRVVQFLKMERKDAERIGGSEENSSENKDETNSGQIIVIDDDNEEIEDEHEDDDIIGDDDSKQMDGDNDSSKEIIEIDADEDEMK